MTEKRFDYERAYAAASSPERRKSSAQSADTLRNSASGRTSRQPASRRAAIRKKRRRQRRLRLLAMIAALVIVIAVVVILLVTCSGKEEPEEVIEEGIPVLSVQAQTATVDELYTYGTHLQMKGTLPSEVADYISGNNVDMVLYNGDFISVPLIISEQQFVLSEYLNGGLYLEEIPRDTYTMFIRVTTDEPPEEETETIEEEIEEDIDEPQTRADGTEETTARRIKKKKPDEPTTSPEDETDENGETREEKVLYYRYYAIRNVSDYPETVYYTMSNVDNRIVIQSESEYPTMQMEVARNTDSGVYDVVIDPGHGGYDAGAIGIDDMCERDFTLPLSLKIKERLEAAGLKVALTRESDAALLEPYGDDGRIARACSKHAKYMISIHMNSMGAGGLEIYTASGIDYTFAETLRDNIKQYSGLGDTLTGGTALQDIFSRMFTQYDVDETIAENEEDGLKPYAPTTRSSYYFIIRETGGIATGAYMDDRNPEEPYNPYCYSNTCLESYITELGYITVEEDLKLMQNNMDGFAKGIADSLISVYGEKKAADETADGTADETGGSSETGESEPEGTETASED